MHTSWIWLLVVIVSLAYVMFGKIDGHYGGFKRPFWRRKKDKDKSS